MAEHACATLFLKIENCPPQALIQLDKMGHGRGGAQCGPMSHQCFSIEIRFHFS